MLGVAAENPEGVADVDFSQRQKFVSGSESTRSDGRERCVRVHGAEDAGSELRVHVSRAENARPELFDQVG